MGKKSFFDRRSEQSRIKTSIVAKYFAAWTRVIIGHQKRKGTAFIEVGYVDPYSGPGRYKDGTPSTPLAVLEHAIGNPDLSMALFSEFNDEDSGFTETLSHEIALLQGIRGLSHAPKVTNFEVDDSRITQLTRSGNARPTLYFFDPWGYKGLTLELIKAALSPWGCDCIFFFNLKRMRAAIRSMKFKAHVDALFGKAVAEKLRGDLNKSRAGEARPIIIDALELALRNAGAKFIHSFLFSDDFGYPSHFIVLTSKNELAYDIIKNITAKESSHEIGGVPSHGFNPRKKNLPTLPGFDTAGIDELEKELLHIFAGQTLSFRSIYRMHNVGTDYVEKNYRDAVLNLETAGKASVVPPMQRRARGGNIICGPNTEITFPA